MNKDNIILVTFDSLRADHCGFMGYEKETTPTIDRLASEGTAFKNAVSPGPSTPESMPVILTGERLPNIEKEFGNKLQERKYHIRNHLGRNLTLPEKLSELGYQTAGFSPNPYTSRYFGFDDIFDDYEDFMTRSRSKLYNRIFDGIPLNSALPIRVILNWAQREEVFKPWESYFDKVESWIRQTSEPYFIWVLLMDTHDPYLPPKDYRSESLLSVYKSNFKLWQQNHDPPFSEETIESLINSYDDTIRYADSFIERLVEIVSDETTLLIHGDHGEAFGEHGSFGHQPYLYEENIHVPFVISQSLECDMRKPLSLQHIPDIVLSIANNQSPAKSMTKEFAISETIDGNRTAVRGANWKYINNHKSSDEALFSIKNMEEQPIEHLELQKIGKGLSDTARQTTKEKKLIKDTIRGLSI